MDGVAVDLANIIEAVILEQLDSFKEELTAPERKLIAHQCALESARRIVSK
jgi:hypothetical protein